PSTALARTPRPVCTTGLRGSACRWTSAHRSCSTSAGCSASAGGSTSSCRNTFTEQHILSNKRRHSRGDSQCIALRAVVVGPGPCREGGTAYFVESVQFCVGEDSA